MPQAIETKYLGPTNTLPSRIVAKCQAARIVVGWRYDLSPERNHTLAALTLAEKLGWSDEWVGGANAKGDGNVYVSTDRRYAEQAIAKARGEP